jgi:hypothetical protein
MNRMMSFALACGASIVVFYDGVARAGDSVASAPASGPNAKVRAVDRLPGAVRRTALKEAGRLGTTESTHAVRKDRSRSLVLSSRKHAAEQKTRDARRSKGGGHRAE